MFGHFYRPGRSHFVLETLSLFKVTNLKVVPGVSPQQLKKKSLGRYQVLATMAPCASSNELVLAGASRARFGDLLRRDAERGKG